MSERVLISRRDFCIGGACLVIPTLLEADLIGLNLALRGTKKLTGWLSEVPPAEYESPRPRPANGWLETQEIHQKRPGLLDTDTGHAKWLVHFFKTDPLIRMVSKQGFSHLFSPENNVKNEKMGEVLNKYINYSQEAYWNIYKEIPDLNNSIHMAVIAFALVHSPYLSIRDIKNLGVEVDNGDITENTSIFWIMKSQDKLPHLLPLPFGNCRSARDILARCLGLDKIVHEAQHQFLTHEYIYAHSHNLQEKTRVPRGVNLFLSAYREATTKAAMLSRGAGALWEIKETKLILGWWLDTLAGKNPFVQTDPKDITTGQDKYGMLPTGLLDSLVAYDLLANKIGREAGIALGKENLTEADVEKVIKDLNDDSLYEVKERALLETLIGLVGN